MTAHARPFASATRRALALGAFILSTTAAIPPSQAERLISQGYLEESLSNQCSFTICTVKFSPVPAGKTLIVNHVSCLWVLPAASKVDNTYITSEVNGPKRAHFLTSSLASTSGNPPQSAYRIDEPIQKLYANNGRPLITVSLVEPASFVVQCTITGQLKP